MGKHAGHPIAGDPKYGDDDFSRELRDLGGKRLFLHARSLQVVMADGQELSVEALPGKMWDDALGRLRNA